jgi:hypothetical protein
MDDEAKQLLREIRDSALREEAATKQAKLVVGIVAVLLLAAVGFLVARVDHMMTEVENVPQPAVPQK